MRYIVGAILAFGICFAVKAVAGEDSPLFNSEYYCQVRCDN
ncbi:MAG: hypothetical protein AAF528_06885 [Cyanobacteria bacterium P01_C01_bin.121]